MSAVTVKKPYGCGDKGPPEPLSPAAQRDEPLIEGPEPSQEEETGQLGSARLDSGRVGSGKRCHSCLHSKLQSPVEIMLATSCMNNFHLILTFG